MPAIDYRASCSLKVVRIKMDQAEIYCILCKKRIWMTDYGWCLCHCGSNTWHCSDPFERSLSLEEKSMPQKIEGKLACSQCGEICQEEDGKIPISYRINPDEKTITCIPCIRKGNKPVIIEVPPEGGAEPARKPSKDCIIPL